MNSLRKLITPKMVKAFALMSTVLVMTGSVLPVNAKQPTPKGVTGSSGNSDIDAALGTDQVNVTGIIPSIADVLGYVTLSVGIILGMIAIYKLVIAIKDQDSNGITQQAVLIVVSVVLMMFRTIISAIFGI